MKATVCDACKEVIKETTENHLDGLVTMDLKFNINTGIKQDHGREYHYDLCGKCSMKITHMLSEIGI